MQRFGERKTGFFILPNVETPLWKLRRRQGNTTHCPLLDFLPLDAGAGASLSAPEVVLAESERRVVSQSSETGAPLTMLPDAEDWSPAPAGPSRPRDSDIN